MLLKSKNKINKNKIGERRKKGKRKVVVSYGIPDRKMMPSAT
jgi:hypothetical protein